MSLVDEASRPRPLPEVLGRLCHEVAAIAGAPVASLYVREGEELVLRANVGLAGRQIGHARLRIGEGITGFAAETRRPVSVSLAKDDEHYVPVPGLDDDRYPVFLAVPVLVGARAEAVLVLQREAQRPFADTQVLLVTSMASVFAYALERSRQDREHLERRHSRRARLAGVGSAPGAALGRAEAPPTFEGLAALARAAGLEDARDPSQRLAPFRAALSSRASVVQRAIRGPFAEAPPEVLGAVSSLALLFEDGRLRAELESAASEHRNPAQGLAAVARRYARASTGGGYLDQRATEVETLCLQLAASVVDVRWPTKGGVMLLAEAFPALLVAIGAVHKVAAFAVGGPVAEDALGLRLARVAGIPVVTDVAGLFAWAREQDRLLVDGDAGVVLLNPGQGVITRFRRSRAGGSAGLRKDSTP
jgi:phosphotransferase system enzyme I (PtsP)